MCHFLENDVKTIFKELKIKLVLLEMPETLKFEK
jgi:hypothetical protein